MNKGFIQLNRDIQDAWFWNEPTFVQAMIDLLLRANHKRKELAFNGKKTIVNRGEHITDYRTLGYAWYCAHSTARDRVKALEKWGEIELLRCKATHLKIVKYDEYLSEVSVLQPIQRSYSDHTNELLNNNENKSSLSQGREVISSCLISEERIQKMKGDYPNLDVETIAKKYDLHYRSRTTNVINHEMNFEKWCLEDSTGINKSIKKSSKEQGNQVKCDKCGFQTEGEMFPSRTSCVCPKLCGGRLYSLTHKENLIKQ